LLKEDGDNIFGDLEMDVQGSNDEQEEKMEPQKSNDDHKAPLVDTQD